MNSVLSIIGASALTCTVALALQWSLWKIRTPKRQSRALVLIFLACSAAGAWGAARGLDWGAGEVLYFAALQAILTADYLITFSAIEVDSPSLVMAEMLAKSGTAGIARPTWYATLNDQVLVFPRIEDLIRDQHVVREGGSLVLTKKGRGFVSLFIQARRVLKTPKGG